MAAARLFDRPYKRYQTRCLRHVLEFVQTHKDNLWEIREPYQLGLSLQAAGLQAKLEPLVPEGGAAFALGLAEHFLGVLDSEAVARELDLLKTLRDKALAHNEDVEPIAGPTWGALTDLAGIAKRLVGLLGWAYLGTAYEIDGRYELSDDAGRPALAMVRLAEHLKTARIGAVRA